MSCDNTAAAEPPSPLLDELLVLVFQSEPLASEPVETRVDLVCKQWRRVRQERCTLRLDVALNSARGASDGDWRRFAEDLGLDDADAAELRGRARAALAPEAAAGRLGESSSAGAHRVQLVVYGLGSERDLAELASVLRAAPPALTRLRLWAPLIAAGAPERCDLQRLLAPALAGPGRSPLTPRPQAPLFPGLAVLGARLTALEGAGADLERMAGAPALRAIGELDLFSFGGRAADVEGALQHLASRRLACRSLTLPYIAACDEPLAERLRGALAAVFRPLCCGAGPARLALVPSGLTALPDFWNAVRFEGLQELRLGVHELRVLRKQPSGEVVDHCAGSSCAATLASTLPLLRRVAEEAAATLRRLAIHELDLVRSDAPAESAEAAVEELVAVLRRLPALGELELVLCVRDRPRWPGPALARLFHEIAGDARLLRAARLREVHLLNYRYGTPERRAVEAAAALLRAREAEADEEAEREATAGAAAAAPAAAGPGALGDRQGRLQAEAHDPMAH
eukprot:tig00000241_g20953.t2